MQQMVKNKAGGIRLAKLVYARSGKSRRIWYGRHKELWIKGAAGSVDQQAVERHW